MAWTCQSALLPPVRLATIPASVFSIYMELLADVEAELDYCSQAEPPDQQKAANVSYRECFVPTEGHFPLLRELLLARSVLPKAVLPGLDHLLHAELSRLVFAGALGNVVILHESIYDMMKQSLGIGLYTYPMENAFALRPTDIPSLLTVHRLETGKPGNRPDIL